MTQSPEYHSVDFYPLRRWTGCLKARWRSANYGRMPQVSRSDVIAAAQMIYADAPFGARLLQSLRPYICPFESLLAHVPASASVLDVGCGAGLLLGLIAHFDPSARGYGFDTSVDAVAAARHMAKRTEFGTRLRFDTWSATMEWPQGSYDVVSMIDVLHHVPPAEHAAVIRTALSRIRPGGLLIYKDMADQPVWQASWNRLHDLLLAKQWVHYRSIRDVGQWVSGAGAESIAEGRIDIGPYAHEFLIAQTDATPLRSGAKPATTAEGTGSSPAQLNYEPI
jgi:2-polyprenyl-3-methyl-5-hydroxy-6-metoxy-1,4-benzoquinol methylase